MKESINTLQNEIQGYRVDNERLQASFKQAFMRGVTALNLEAISMMKQPQAPSINVSSISQNSSQKTNSTVTNNNNNSNLHNNYHQNINYSQPFASVSDSQQPKLPASFQSEVDAHHSSLQAEMSRPTGHVIKHEGGPGSGKYPPRHNPSNQVSNGHVINLNVKPTKINWNQYLKQ